MQRALAKMSKLRNELDQAQRQLEGALQFFEHASGTPVLISMLCLVYSHATDVCKLPRSHFELYKAAIDAGGDLKNCHILVTQPFKQALKKQLKNAPRVNGTRVKIRSVELLANFFGPEGAELRTISTWRTDPSDSIRKSSLVHV